MDCSLFTPYPLKGARPLKSFLFPENLQGTPFFVIIGFGCLLINHNKIKRAHKDLKRSESTKDSGPLVWVMIRGGTACRCALFNQWLVCTLLMLSTVTVLYSPVDNKLRRIFWISCFSLWEWINDDSNSSSSARRKKKSLLCICFWVTVYMSEKVEKKEKHVLKATPRGSKLVLLCLTVKDYSL